jgi:hypothetical protein
MTNRTPEVRPADWHGRLTEMNEEGEEGELGGSLRHFVRG